jgi:hypothetical protein
MKSLVLSKLSWFLIFLILSLFFQISDLIPQVNSFGKHFGKFFYDTEKFRLVPILTK